MIECNNLYQRAQEINSVVRLTAQKVYKIFKQEVKIKSNKFSY